MIIGRGEQRVSYPGWDSDGHIRKCCLDVLRLDKALVIFKTVPALALIVSHSQLCRLLFGSSVRQL